MSVVTKSPFLGGRLTLLQPEKGHRAGTDAVLLAASAAPKPGETLFDLGAGVGAAGLAVAIRAPECRIRLVEIVAEIEELADANIRENGLGAHVAAMRADVTAPLLQEGPMQPSGADYVIMNPPFHLEGTVRAPPSAYRGTAHIHGPEGDEAWIRCAHALLRSKGTLTIIHRADALPRLLAALDRRFGDIRIKPVLPRMDEPAGRILLRAVKDSRAPLVLLPPLVLHGADGAFTPEAQALHRGEGLIDWRNGG
ncbi:tRNA1(Val) (adenine(37)-N6)-methyltransferase [Labrys monachus]|uniref:tRNA1(Val) A37 N6-methylase TrmN6 n=1 Tax=Labrys monachus TaxID=217067 RepID=A0ABU0FC15_9HYPH|nr:methyltransferase [Labrys monachus]MDQ0391638.1 tRNA1(Val) A37 N6-methylase TrmN6 [Labrys monachus]